MSNSEPDGLEPIPSMYTPSQLRLLKIAVIAMGVILLVGFTVVIGRIIYLVNVCSPPAGAAKGVAAVGVGASTTQSAPLRPGHIALPKGAVVRHIALSGSNLAVHYESPAGTGIQVIDLATGGPGVTVTLGDIVPAPR